METGCDLATQSRQDVLDVDSRDLVDKHTHQTERIALEKE